MVHAWLADLVLLLHLGFVLFATLGGLLTLRWPAVAWGHLPAVAWGAYVEFAGRVCPLTPLENWLRRRAGEAAYEGSFIERYVVALLYPGTLTTELQVTLGTLLLVVNAIVYGVVWRRAHRAAPRIHASTANEPKRHPAALAGAITRAWRPYRWRAFAVAFLAGIVAGGIVAPTATASLALLLALAGGPSIAVAPWPHAVWTLAFALTVPTAGAAAFARWQPRLLRTAAETYIWLAARAEENWARAFGTRPMPRAAPDMRALLAELPESPETAAMRSDLWSALLEIDRARSAAAQMPVDTPQQRFDRASTEWLIDFAAGTAKPLDPLTPLAGAIEDDDARTAACVSLAVHRARVAFAEGRDWKGPLAAVRDRLGTAPDRPYRTVVWRPMFRQLLITTAVGVIVFWIAVFAFGGAHAQQ
jgi:hypothetical protein